MRLIQFISKSIVTAANFVLLFTINDDKNMFSNLPYELLVNICIYLECFDLITLSKTNKKMHALISNIYFWKNLCNIKFGLIFKYINVDVKEIHDLCSIDEFREPVILVTGPRFVGKTTLLNNMGAKFSTLLRSCADNCI